MEEIKIPTTQFSDKDIYTIEMKEGVKFIHFQGYIYTTGDDIPKPWRIVEPAFMEEPLSEFIDKYTDDIDHINNMYEEHNNYYNECDEETAREWLDGWRDMIKFPCEKLSVNMPCGTYINM